MLLEQLLLNLIFIILRPKKNFSRLVVLNLIIQIYVKRKKLAINQSLKFWKLELITLTGAKVITKSNRSSDVFETHICALETIVGMVSANVTLCRL